MRGEGRNVSRPVEFSAARPLPADKAGRAKSGLQAASPESTPQARSPQPCALSPQVAAATLPSPGKSGCPGSPEDSEDQRGLAAKSKSQKSQTRAGRGARGSTAGQRAGPGMAVRGEEAPALSPPRPFRHPHPALASLHPPTPGWQKFAKSGRPGCRAPRGGSAPSPAHLSAGARSSARPAPARSPRHPSACPPEAPTAAR